MDYFELKHHGTTKTNEIFAGILIFSASMYILILNPIALSSVGMNQDGVFIATVLATFLVTMISAFYAKMPILFAPGIVAQTYFVTLAADKGWRYAILVTYAGGLVLLLFSRFNLFTYLNTMLTDRQKKILLSGLGLALAIVGMRQCGITKNNFELAFESISCVLAVILLFIINTRMKRRNRIISTVLLFFLLTVLDLFVFGGLKEYPIEPISEYKVKWTNFSQVVFQFPHFKGRNIRVKDIFSLLKYVLVFVYVHFLDNVVCLGADLKILEKEDKKLNTVNIKKIMQVDAIGVIISACCGTAPTTIYAESFSGILVGGRTGLTAMTTAICFLCAIILLPFFTAISPCVVAPFLIFAGLRMFFLGIKIHRKGFYGVCTTLFGYILIGYIGHTFDLANSLMLLLSCQSIHLLIKRNIERKQEITASIILLCLLLIVLNRWL